MKKFLKLFLTSFLKESPLIPMILWKLINFMISSWWTPIQLKLLIILIKTILKGLLFPNIKFSESWPLLIEIKKPFTCKAFSQPFHPMSYNYMDYMDYMDAWYNMLYLQSYQHSWFIQFSRNYNTKYPAWFQKWWTFFSLLDSIFPLEIQEKFNFYKSKTSSQSITQD